MRLTAASSQYGTRTSSPVNINAAYTAMWWGRLKSFTGGNWQSWLYLYNSSNNDRDQFGVAGDTQRFLFANVGAGNTGTNSVTVSTINVDTWYHFAAVRSSQTLLTVYLNFDPLTAATLTNDMTGRNACDTMRIGARFNATEFLDGDINGIKIIQAALTWEEIAKEALALAPWSGVSYVAALKGDGTAYTDETGATWTASGGNPTSDTGPPLPTFPSGAGVPLPVSLSGGLAA